MNFHLLNFIGGVAEISEIDISNLGKQDQSYPVAIYHQE